MSKNEQKNQMGNKIPGKKASAEKYKKLYEFLLFDPLYKDMRNDAKILYCYLRDKVPYFENLTEEFESGMENTRSYRDEEGYIFIVADNTELELILNVTEPTLRTVKKELMTYGLLKRVPQPHQADRLYPLEPSQLTERWKHIEEFKKKRAERKEQNIAKREKRKEQNKAKEEANQKNLSEANQKNLSEAHLKNLGQIEPKSFKSNLSSEIEPNLSINDEEIEKLDVPVQLIKLLKENDGWMDHSISLGEIERNYKYHQETVSVEQYISAFEFALKQDEIGEFEKIMARNVEKQLEFKNNRQNYDSSNSKQEHLPDWFKEQKEQENQEQNESLEEVSPEQIQKEKEELQKSIKARSQKRKQESLI